MHLLRLAALASLIALPAWAEGEVAGDFDYYVLALSWQPNWCALEGDSRDAPECRDGSGAGFTLHGLWPQYEQGWPSYCRSPARDPSRAQSAAMADVMGSPGLAWHQWKKHGRCTGLGPADYFALSRQALDRITLPDVFARLDREIELPAHVVEAAFLETNPDLRRDQITITCKAGHIQEVRICLDTDLRPRRCGGDVIQDCRLEDAVMAPPR